MSWVGDLHRSFEGPGQSVKLAPTALEGFMQPAHESDAILDLLVRWDELRRQGRNASPEELCPDDPHLQDLLRERLAKRQRMQEALDLPGDTQLDVLPRPPAAIPAIAGYEIGALLGRGGMGLVYKARQVALQRNVALKMVISGAHAGADERARFRNEAEAVARLQHPNIVQIYEIGEQDGCPFVAFEYVGGGSLDRLIDGKPLPPRRAAQMLLDLARAVQHAHEQGIIHRDLKPANVLLTEAGVPKIADFGLAKRLDADVSRTQTGAVLGSPNYMSPEQAEGRVRAIGPATDVYALGAILYEMLTGRPPFLAASLMETLDQVRTHDPPPPQTLQPRVPDDLATICLKCLEKSPGHRYLSAAALADDLQRFLGDEPIAARKASVVDQVHRLLRNSQVDVNFGAWSTLTLCLAPIPLVAHVSVFLFFRQRADYPIIALCVSAANVLVSLYSMLFGKRASFALIPRAQRRQVQSTWLGHAIGFVLIPVLVVRMIQPTTPEQWFLIYALWLAQVGGTFFGFAANAGFMYVNASLCFSLALIVPWIPHYAPLVVGFLMSFNMTTQGLFLRRLARETS